MQEIEAAALEKLGDYMESSSDDDEPNPYDDMFANFTDNDFLRLIRELKRQIYAVFKEAGKVYNNWKSALWQWMNGFLL